MELLSREEILEALRSLSTELPTDQPCELALLGGAAMVLAYAARDSTKDVDAVILAGAPSKLREAARRVASVRRLPEDWLNDAAKGYVHGLALGPSLFETPSLRVRALAAERLAMKLSAWRGDTDIDDARLLLGALAGEREAVWDRIAPHVVPGRELKARYAFDDLWEALNGSG